MLAAFCKNEKSSNCAHLIGTVTQAHEGGLISKNTSLISASSSLLSSTSSDDGMDVCSFYSGPSDATIMAFGESCGSIAFAGSGESCGSIASSFSGSVTSGGGSFSSGGGCSYSC